MEKQIYMKPQSEVVNFEAETLLAGSVNASDLGIDYGGNASDAGVTEADTRRRRFGTEAPWVGNED